MTDLNPEGLEKAADAMSGLHFIEHGPGYGEHAELTPPAPL